MQPSPAESTRGYAQFVDALAERMGLGAELRRPGTSVVAAADRAGSSTVVTYSIAAHTVLWCDPDLADELGELADGTRTTPLTEVAAWAAARGWEQISINHMQLLRSQGIVRPNVAPPGVIRTLHRDTEADLAMIDAFKAALSDEDREEADLDGEGVDEHLVALVDEHGIAAFASQQPFRHAPSFADIAVATRPDVRGRGLGRFVVAALCDQIEQRGLFPLYRRDASNAGSVRLSAALGFVPVIEVVASTRPSS